MVFLQLSDHAILNSDLGLPSLLPEYGAPAAATDRSVSQLLSAHFLAALGQQAFGQDKLSELDAIGLPNQLLPLNQKACIAMLYFQGQGACLDKMGINKLGC